MSAAIIVDVVHTLMAPLGSESARPTIEGFVRHAKR
jgi:hypothetical protein